MKLSRLEKKVLVKLKKRIVLFSNSNAIEDFDGYYNEDVENRIECIDLTINLLKEEKSLIKMLNKS
jgi:hypothetical protein